MLCVLHNATRGHKILMSFNLASFPQQNSDIWAMEQDQKRALWCLTLKRSGI